MTPAKAQRTRWMLTARAYRALGYEIPADVDDDETIVFVPPEARPPR